MIEPEIRKTANQMTRTLEGIQTCLANRKAEPLPAMVAARALVDLGRLGDRLEKIRVGLDRATNVNGNGRE
jgi:hypothetical protein